MRANKMSGTQKGERKEMNEMKGSLRKKEIDKEKKRKKKERERKKERVRVVIASGDRFTY